MGFHTVAAPALHCPQPKRRISCPSGPRPPAADAALLAASGKAAETVQELGQLMHIHRQSHEWLSRAMLSKTPSKLLSVLVRQLLRNLSMIEPSCLKEKALMTLQQGLGKLLLELGWHSADDSGLQTLTCVCCALYFLTMVTINVNSKIFEIMMADGDFIGSSTAPTIPDQHVTANRCALHVSDK